MSAKSVTRVTERGSQGQSQRRLLARGDEAEEARVLWTRRSIGGPVDAAAYTGASGPPLAQKVNVRKGSFLRISILRSRFHREASMIRQGTMNDFDGGDTGFSYHDGVAGPRGTRFAGDLRPRHGQVHDRRRATSGRELHHT